MILQKTKQLRKERTETLTLCLKGPREKLCSQPWIGHNKQEKLFRIQIVFLRRGSDGIENSAVASFSSFS